MSVLANNAGWIVGAIVALAAAAAGVLKIRPESGAIVVDSAEKAVDLVTKSMERLQAELDRNREELQRCHERLDEYDRVERALQSEVREAKEAARIAERLAERYRTERDAALAEIAPLKAEVERLHDIVESLQRDPGERTRANDEPTSTP